MCRWMAITWQSAAFPTAPAFRCWHWKKNLMSQTAAALSGWSSLVEELYYQDTPDRASTNLLIGVAPLAGAPPMN